MIRTEPSRYRLVASRGARLAPRSGRELNEMMVTCVVLIVVAFLLGILKGRLGTSDGQMGVMVQIAMLFAILVVLVILRLGPEVLTAVAKQTAPGTIGRVLGSLLALVALGVAVVAFFFATCAGMTMLF
jgi:uncharacterized membrane protein